MGQKIEFEALVQTFSPTLSTSPAYSTGDQLGTVITITNATDEKTGTATLTSVGVIDKDKVDCAFDVLFFSSNPSPASADNAALNISDANMAAYYLGRVSVSTYNDLSANSDATVSASGCGIKLKADKDGTIYAVCQAKANAGGAYASASSLAIRFGIDKD